MPFPEELMLVTFLTGLNLAMTSPRLEGILWLALVALIRLSFYGFLRPGEAVGLRASDLKVIRRPTAETVLVVAIRAPKTAHAPGAGRSKVATVKDAGAIVWAGALLSLIEENAPLWPTTRGKHTAMCRYLLFRAHLSGLGLTPASLRSGEPRTSSCLEPPWRS